MDVLSLLHLELLATGDRAFSSKGHDAPAPTRARRHRARSRSTASTRCAGSAGCRAIPTSRRRPRSITSTGSLGHGRLQGARPRAGRPHAGAPRRRVYVITGDGELQEGQFWESLQPTANRGLRRDHRDRRPQQAAVRHMGLARSPTSATWRRKVAAFGWAVARCDGHDVAAVRAAIGGLQADAGGRPQLLIADTVKGRGVSFMEPHDLPVRRRRALRLPLRRAGRRRVRARAGRAASPHSTRAWSASAQPPVALEEPARLDAATGAAGAPAAAGGRLRRGARARRRRAARTSSRWTATSTSTPA